MKYKKILMTVITLALLILLSGSVQAAPYADVKCGGNATWQIDDKGTLVISGTGAVTDAPWYDYYRYDFDKVLISEGITSLPDQGFRNCSNLQQLTIPVSLTAVGEGCFTGCNSLKTVTYNGTLAQWQKISFLDTSSPLFLAKLNCTDAYYNLCGSNVFWMLDTNGMLYITGSGAMSDYSASNPAPWHSLYGSIKTVTIGDGITTIGSYAFYNLDPYEPFAMTQITIPKSLISVGAMAFSDCTLLTDVYYADTVDRWTRLTVGSHNETLQSVAIHGVDRTVSMCGQSTYWELDSYGTLIIAGQGPTANWNGYTTPPWHEYRLDIKKAVICEGVTHLGNRAFESNYVEEIILADSVLSIGNYAFENCFMKKITIGNKLISLGEGAFEGCDYLKDITLPDTVTSIGKFAFRNCESLERVSLGTGLTTIGKESFAGCVSLKEVVLPNGVTVIEECTFLDCKAVTRITLPKNLKTVGEGTFYNCSSLTKIILPDSVTKVGYQAFRNCISLTEINIPTSVDEIGWETFAGTSLKSVYYAGTESQWQSLTIDEGNDCLTTAVVYYNGERSQDYDLNLDGVLDSEDAVYLLLHTMFGEAFYPLSGTPADVDGSGLVDQNDAVYLLLHTMFGDAFYPLKRSALPE